MWVGGCVTAPTAWASPPGRRRRSVHKSVEMASRRRFGAFVYTVAPWARVVGGLGIAIVYTNGRIGPLLTGLGCLCTLLCCCGQTRGRNSVHRSPKTASPRRIGAFVYTVATRVAIRIATRAAPGGTSASTATACRRRPLAGPSRLVGKTGSARVAPLPGWHLGRGVNPHEPLKSLDFLVILNLIGKHIQSFITVGPANRAFLNSLIFRIAVGVENERRRTQASPLEVLEVPGRCYTVIRSRFWKGHHASSIAKSTAR